MQSIKLTSWNVQWLDKLLEKLSGGASPQAEAYAKKRLKNVADEIEELDADVICMIEGPNTEAKIDNFCSDTLGGRYLAIKAANGQYAMKGRQWIWFLVKPEVAATFQPELLSPAIWQDYVRNERENITEGHTGRSWLVFRWGDITAFRHSHYRHPQVLVLEIDGKRVEVIGAHLKSKFSKEGRYDGTPSERKEFLTEVHEARAKLCTEAENIRHYIDARFKQEKEPAIFVVGDLNDGPGKELFERQLMLFDLVNNIQGSIFEAYKYLNHALFTYPERLRWSVYFKDKIDKNRDPHILLDHIFFTQGLVRGNLPVRERGGAALVEHEIHDRINANQRSQETTSDHKPISCFIDIST